MKINLVKRSDSFELLILQKFEVIVRAYLVGRGCDFMGDVSQQPSTYDRP